MTAWCAHPRLARDEPLSLWLHRYAWANGLSNHTFGTRLFGPRAVWPRDMDRSIDDALLAQASDVLGVPIDRLRRATLRRYEGTVFDPLSSNGWQPWLLPLGVYHRLNRHHGQMLCPRCLAEGLPARLVWRFAFTVACARHGCRLLDACPACDAPLMPHRLCLEPPGHRPCPTCGANLACAQAPVPLSVRALCFQRRGQRAARGNEVIIGNQRIGPRDFLWGTRLLIRGLYGNARLAGLTQARAATRRRAAWHDGLPQSLTPFEYWRLPLRMAVLADVERYLEAWPERFIQDALRAHVYRCRFDSRQRLTAPAWLLGAIEAVEQLR